MRGEKRIHVALTIDVEQWDLASRRETHLALIAALGDVASTWFVAEDRSQSFSERYPDVAERLLRSGHEIGAHVHFAVADETEMVKDVRRATLSLRAIGSSCASFRGGAHVFNHRLADEIHALGYRFDSSAVPGLIRRYRTRNGDTFAAYPHLWSARPFWWRPGLLELPTASFPLTRPISFLRRRFRLPLLLSRRREFRARLDQLAEAYPATDVPVVIIGHSFDVEHEGRPEPQRLRALRESLGALSKESDLRFLTLEKLGSEIASGVLSVGLRDPPSPLVSAVAVHATTQLTRVFGHPLIARLTRRITKPS